jgi:hypothetical protein
MEDGVGNIHPAELQGCFETCTGDGSPDTDTQYPMDTDSILAAYFMLDSVQCAFDEHGLPKPQTKAYGCVDVCVKVEVPAFNVQSGRFTYVSDQEAADFLRIEIINGAIGAVENAGNVVLEDFEVDSFSASTVKIDTQLVEGESSGEEPTTEPTSEPVSSYSQCLSLYFPFLWLLQTAFSTIFNFCPIFEHELCYAFDAAGAECWQYHCDTTCSGDGTPEIDHPMDDDFEAEDASEQTDGDHTCWAGNSVDSNYNIGLFGCFDVCFEIQATDSQLANVMAMLGLGDDGRFVGGLENWFEDVAELAVVQAMVAGPSGDGTDGYPGGVDAMSTDTENSGAFDCGADACTSGNLNEAAASTTFASEEVETATGRNCDDGNNGNCTHTCSGAGLNGVCSCPNECWELDTDGESCMIPADKVQLSCESDRMVAYLARCVVRDNNNFMLGNDNDCNEFGGEGGDTTPVVTNPDPPIDNCPAGIVDLSEGCVEFEVRLDECSTRVEADYENNILSFTQNLVSEVQPHMQTGAIGLGAIVSKAARVSVEFTCEYKTDYETSPGNAIVSPDEVNNALESQGQFVFNLNTIQLDPGRMAHSSGWSIYDSQSDPYMVGSTLYFEICSANILSNIYFSVPDCTVKNANETESYKILDNHNLDVFVATARVGRQYEGMYKDWTEAEGPISMPASDDTFTDEISNECLVFSYTVFEFITSNENDGDLRLSCDVHACNYDDGAPEDIAACVSSGGRKRRDALMHETYYRVSLNIPIQHTDQV